VTRPIAEAFIDAVAQRDRAALSALLTPDVDFRGLTPSRPWEAHTPDDVVDVVLGNWFGEQDRIVAVTEVAHGRPVGDVRRVGYRLDGTNPDGAFTVEQQAYYRASMGQLSYLRVLCSGFRPREGWRLLE
jgi:hypothetical protein